MGPASINGVITPTDSLVIGYLGYNPYRWSYVTLHITCFWVHFVTTNPKNGETQPVRKKTQISAEGFTHG